MSSIQLDYQLILDSPIGKLGIQIMDNKLSKLKILPKSDALKFSDSVLGKLIRQELAQYFLDAHHHFSIPILLEGTTLQEKIWLALKKIPTGQVKSYGDLAKELKTGPRVIGSACKNNPIALIVPCHRVIASNGIGGFGGTTTGSWIDTKRWLLLHENYLTENSM